MADDTPDFSAILEVLTRHEVDFIVVGGVLKTILWHDMLARSVKHI